MSVLTSYELSVSFMFCIMHPMRVPVHKTPFCFAVYVLGTVNCHCLMWMELLHVLSVFSYFVELNVFQKLFTYQ